MSLRPGRPLSKPLPKPRFPEASLIEKLKNAPGGPIELATHEEAERMYRVPYLKVLIYKTLDDPNTRPGAKWFLKQALNFL